MAPRPPALRPRPRGPRRRPPAGRRGALLAVGVVALLAIAAALTLSGGGDDDPDQPARTTTAPAGLQRSVADPPQTAVLTRPNSLTIADGQVWAMSYSDGAVVLIDAATGERGERLALGPGLSSLAAGFGSVWVAKSDARTRNVLRINARTRQRVSNGIVEIARPGRNVAIATGAGAVWVAVRNLSASDRSPEAIVRIDPSTRMQREIAVPDGVQDLAVGEGAVWVTNRFASTVTKIRVSDGRQDRVSVGEGPKGIAVGEGAVWVASSLDDEITRINPNSLQTRHIPIEAIPERITVGGGSVWATAKEAGRLIRIDAKTRKVLERIDTGPRPFALDITRGRAVWLTLLDSGGVQRVRFERPG